MKNKETLIENYYTVYKKHLNRHNTLFGEQILYWLDEVMGMCIRKYSTLPFVTASIDNYQFLDSVNVDELLIIKSYVSKVGIRSVEIFAEVSAFDISNKSTRLVGICFSTFCLRKDVNRDVKLRKLEISDCPLEIFVIDSYEDRKNNIINMREFSKNYLDLLDRRCKR